MELNKIKKVKSTAGYQGCCKSSLCHFSHVLLGSHMSLVLRKPVFRGFRPGPIQTRLYSHRRWLVARNFGFRKKRDCTICVANTKTLILILRKPVFGVFDQVRYKPGCTATEDGLWLEISDLGRRGIVLSV